MLLFENKLKSGSLKEKKKQMKLPNGLEAIRTNKPILLKVEQKRKNFKAKAFYGGLQFNESQAGGIKAIEKN